MKIYTLFSPSHKQIFDEWFLPSLTKTNSNVDIRHRVCQQVCPSANYLQPGWKETMIQKNEFILDSLNECNDNEILMHTDVDVQFFKDIQKHIDLNLNDYDVLCQQDGPSVTCYGVMIIKNSDKIKNFFKFILNSVKGSRETDQALYNRFHKDYNINTKFQDEKFFSIWMRNGAAVWNGENIENIPNDLVLHHANYTIGVNNKIKLLDMVKKCQKN